MSDKPSRYQGLLYRALNPVWSRKPLSGEGAAQFGGRFNRRGIAALYTSLSPETALREANQVGTLQPTTLVAYRADIAPIFDARQADGLEPYGLTPQQLADPAWRQRMLGGEHVPTQDLAARLCEQGFVGLICPSYARGAPGDAANLVLWRWDGMLEVVDDEDRLGRLHS